MKKLITVNNTSRIRNLACCALLPLALLTAGGCDDFLERSSQTLLVPKTTAQYKEILQGEGYFRNLLTVTSTYDSDSYGYGFIEFMTDDVELFDVTTDPSCPRTWKTTKVDLHESVERYLGSYRWDVSIENSAQIDKVYLYLYRQAMVANICLEGLEESEGSNAEKEILSGQAAFTRAFAYFMLANIYAKPYSIAKPTDLCVPLKTTSTPTVEAYSRATVEQVWAQITGDMALALQNLRGKNLERNVYEISYPAALILAQRIALYMEDWQRAIAYGQEYVDTYAARYPIYDISGKDTSGSRGSNSTPGYVERFMNTADNTEVAWCFGNRSSQCYSYFINPGTLSSTTTNYGRYYRVSSKMQGNLMSTYEAGDRRKAYWFFHPQTNGATPTEHFDYVVIKDDNSSDAPNKLYLRTALRSSEVYLNLAEALARQPQPDPAAAVQLLNQLRERRFNPAQYAPLTAADFATADALVKYIWAERRRELCFEELHRWWDLRRTTRPRIVHPWLDNTAYVLEEDDPGYVLNFPEAELTFNGSALVPNQRPRRSQIPYNP
jgi:hypothetical protein